MNDLLNKKIKDLKVQMADAAFQPDSAVNIFKEDPHRGVATFCKKVASRLDILADGEESTRVFLVQNYFFISIFYCLLRSDIRYELRPKKFKLTPSLRELILSMSRFKDSILTSHIQSQKEILDSEVLDDLIKKTMLAEEDLSDAFIDVHVGW